MWDDRNKIFKNKEEEGKELIWKKKINKLKKISLTFLYERTLMLEEKKNLLNEIINYRQNLI